MAPRRRPGSSNDNNDTNSDVVSSSSSTSITDSIISTSSQSPSATALFNTAVPDPTTSSPPAGLVNAAPAPAKSGQSSTSVKIIGGIVAALIGILIIFSVTIFYLKRRWKAREEADARRGAMRDAKAQHDEEEGGGEGTAFIGDKKVHGRGDSLASMRSKTSSDDYLKSSRKRSSLGTYHTPGIAAEEAYMMFGGSTADLNDDEEKRPLSYHERHLSESSMASKRASWSGVPAPTDPRARRISLLDDESRYPVINASSDSLGRRQMRHSVSYPPGVVDPFGDTTTPTASPPKPPHRALTTGDVTHPVAKPAGARPPPGAAAPGNPAGPGGRRISLKGGVGVRRNSNPSSPVGSPKAAWK
ncbi:hypothetical protein FS837_004329 [Tulasnella sp. UAMH 9824]|nr:hypothetical protein FS837_004329 [Tulasnella sp. UAMH 9824]